MIIVHAPSAVGDLPSLQERLAARNPAVAFQKYRFPAMKRRLACCAYTTSQLCSENTSMMKWIKRYAIFKGVLRLIRGNRRR
jgi:hypothetical protein